jgi:subtilisin family serine protease
MSPRLSVVAAATLCLLAATPLPTTAQVTHPAPAATLATARTPVTRADQLPRRSVTLTKLPSELLEAPIAELLPLADQLERDIHADLAQFDIQDNATLRGIHQTLASLAMLRGHWSALPGHAARLRELTDKPEQCASTGVLLELLAEVKGGGGDAASQAARLTERVGQRYGALDWATSQDSIKQLKASLETANREVVIGSFRSQLDAVARSGNLTVPAGLVAGILASRANLDALFPLRQAILAGLTPVVDRQMAAQAPRADRWSERLVTLAPTERATPVTVAVWDSGIDMALFQPAAAAGLAFDDQGRPSPDILRPLGEARARWPQLRGIIEGSLDLQAGLDTEAARRFRQTMASLKADQVKGFSEDASLVSMYVHGTHVGGIAVAGNPFARVFPVAMHWGYTFPPVKPTEEISRRVAANYQTIVDRMKAAGVRVVNMSWRYGPGAYEAILTVHGVGKDAEERKQIAARLFAVERDALRSAFQSAPDILFVAGSGNENNSADFNEYIPGGFDLPNLISVGATDSAGLETTFSTAGRTVAVHANGLQVDSLIPGGDRMKISGASMAAPQVTNLAAKLLALDPSLKPAQLKALILQHAERNGRVNWIHPRRTLEALRAGRSAG